MVQICTLFYNLEVINGLDHATIDNVQQKI